MKEDFLVSVNDIELYYIDLIGSPLVTWVEHVEQSISKKKKKKEEVHNIETDEDNASEENGSGFPIGGGGEEYQVYG
jgi:hypothetical protein